MALGLSFGKFMTGYETRFQKKIHRSRTNKYVICVRLYKSVVRRNCISPKAEFY